MKTSLKRPSADFRHVGAFVSADITPLTESQRSGLNRRPLSTTNPSKNAKGARGNGLAHVSAAGSAFLCTESHPKTVPETSLVYAGGAE